MLPDRSRSVKQTTAKGNRDPEGGGNMGLRTGLGTKFVHYRHNGCNEACWLGWKYEHALQELQVRQGKEKPYPDSQTQRRQTHIV